MKDCERGIGALTGAIHSLLEVDPIFGVRGGHWAQTVQRSMWILTRDSVGQDGHQHCDKPHSKGRQIGFANKCVPTGVEPPDCQGDLRQLVSGFLKSKFIQVYF